MKSFAIRHITVLIVGAVVAAAAAFAPAALARPLLDRVSNIERLASTVPAHGSSQGDQNPYGVAVVPRSVGHLVRGDVLVSNFNNSQNQQGTGSSIVQVSPNGKAHVFAVVPAPASDSAVGLTTALVVLRSGYVVVGNLPAAGGMSSAAQSGALTILNSRGHVVKRIVAKDINGPWDMTALDGGGNVVLFVTNLLNGTVAANGGVVHKGTVVRINLAISGGHVPDVVSNQVIATGFGEHTDPNALVVGPTGVGLANDGTLYVADSVGNRIAAIPHALTRHQKLTNGGRTVSSGAALNDPLGLTIARNGHIVTVNGADGNAVETTPKGHQVAVRTLVSNGGGDLFGIASIPHAKGLYFVDDAGSGPAANSLDSIR